MAEGEGEVSDYRFMNQYERDKYFVKRDGDSWYILFRIIPAEVDKRDILIRTKLAESKNKAPLVKMAKILAGLTGGSAQYLSLGNEKNYSLKPIEPSLQEEK